MLCRARPLSTQLTRALLRAMSSSSPSGGASATRYKIYTKTGDLGSSSLYNGARLSKDEEFFSALGDVDELNASIGLAREYCATSGIDIETQLVEIQCRLLDVGSAIATPKQSSSEGQLERAKFNGGITSSLESWIDAMDAELPPLKNFILPVRPRMAAAVRPPSSSPLLSFLTCTTTTHRRTHKTTAVWGLSLRTAACCPHNS